MEGGCRRGWTPYKIIDGGCADGINEVNEKLEQKDNNEK